MYMIVEVSQYVAVASFSEAWIEISMNRTRPKQIVSPPSRRRGLKSYEPVNAPITPKVASFSEAWIEIA